MLLYFDFLVNRLSQFLAIFFNISYNQNMKQTRMILSENSVQLKNSLKNDIDKNTEIEIYTDGACSFNPGPGGWGAVLIYKDVKKEISGGDKNTTNNIMEITAVLEALKLLKHPCKVNVYSDSAYVVNCFNQGWIYNWMKKGWKTAGNDPVKNKELWEELYNLTKIHEVTFNKVKGHSTNELNNRCDELARNAIPE